MCGQATEKYFQVNTKQIYDIHKFLEMLLAAMTFLVQKISIETKMFLRFCQSSHVSSYKFIERIIPMIRGTVFQVLL